MATFLEPLMYFKKERIKALFIQFRSRLLGLQSRAAAVSLKYRERRYCVGVFTQTPELCSSLTTHKGCQYGHLRSVSERYYYQIILKLLRSSLVHELRVKAIISSIQVHLAFIFNLIFFSSVFRLKKAQLYQGFVTNLATKAIDYIHR